MLSEEPERLQEVIIHTQGNLTQAARLLRMSKQHIFNLVKRWELNDWARQIRVIYGHPATGNPSKYARVKETPIGQPPKRKHLTVNREIPKVCLDERARREATSP